MHVFPTGYTFNMKKKQKFSKNTWRSLSIIDLLSKSCVQTEMQKNSLTKQKTQ
jgi:hypothetical protein